ncbi:hypothetical protein [Sulfobacillus thermosulfidooxidans]|uniref:hypothetical protein n=1 Tax=Sulfobacillus thermosulfidooxidans TaxID=28034 RepID=UPI000417DD64|nr:hypothetical protein [Sulfobacillus thermosulfidooxidans]
MKGIVSFITVLGALLVLTGCGAVLAPRIGASGYPRAVAWIDHRLKPKDYILLIGLSQSPHHHPMTVYIMRRRVSLMGLSLPRNTLIGIVVNPKQPDWMGRVYYQLPHERHRIPLVRSSNTPAASSS